MKLLLLDLKFELNLKGVGCVVCVGVVKDGFIFLFGIGWIKLVFLNFRILDFVDFEVWVVIGGFVK